MAYLRAPPWSGAAATEAAASAPARLLTSARGPYLHTLGKRELLPSPGHPAPFQTHITFPQSISNSCLSRFGYTNHRSAEFDIISHREEPWGQAPLVDLARRVKVTEPARATLEISASWWKVWLQQVAVWSVRAAPPGGRSPYLVKPY